tara:strand:+ start:583 stop:813 length:231 start_codon:yes stop_codon:yes gene_type:complete
MSKKIVNGVVMDLTAEEIADYQTTREKELADKKALETAQKAKEDNQASGNKKLLDLGLSQAEATALTGYTPPVEEE